MADLTSVPPPDAIQPISYETILADMLAYMRAQNAIFTTIKESDPGYTILEACAYKVVDLIKAGNDGVLACMVTHAKGADLDNLGIIYNERRRAQETDDEYRNRLINAFASLALGSYQWYRDLVIGNRGRNSQGDLLFPTVKDVHVLGPENDSSIPPGEVHCYIELRGAGYGDNPLPSAGLVGQVQAWLDTNTPPAGTARALNTSERFLNDTIRCYRIQQKPYTLSLSFVETPGYDRATVRESLTERVRVFENNNRVATQRIPLSAIYAALEGPDVLEITLDYPKANVVPSLTEVAVARKGYELEVTDYIAFTTWATFGDQTGAKWSLATYNSKPYLVFTEGISAADLDALNGVGAGRKFTVIEKTDPPVTKLSLQVITDMDNYTNANNKKHYYFELAAAPDLTNVSAGALTVAWADAIEVNP